METYHRRRYKKTNQPCDKMVYLEMQEQNGISSTATPALVRHDYVPTSLSASAHGSFNDTDGDVPSTDPLFSDIESIELGSVYELNHIYLPPRTPAHLRSIRVVMVTEKTQLNVAVRFPSMDSLETYFGNSIREMYPELDEKFVMGTVLAAKVLRREVPSQEFKEKKHLEGFWLVKAASVDVMEEDGGLEKGTCLAELKCKGMVRWGIRRQVKFLERQQEKINVLEVQPSSSFVKESKEVKLGRKRQLFEEEEEEEDEEQEDGGDNDDKEKDEEEEDEQENDEGDDDISEQETAVMEETRDTQKNLLKGKRYKLRSNGTREIAKKVKLEKKRQKKSHGNGNKGRNKCRELLVLENPKDRWSAERYHLATKNLLEVMKAKGATATNPILRPDLRAEARKRIGDTGLLDHLLKHMAGKLAPGGADRFRRRHNADGAMEYWLESADLVNIRKEAGVDDPYWIPPPGWSPGDCPTQDPVCAKELRLLKEKIFKLERNAEEMVPRKQYDEDIVKLRREIEQLVCSQKHKENEATEVLSNPSYISQTLGQLGASLKSPKVGLEELLHPVGKFEEQLMVISNLVKGIEQEIKKLMTNAEGKTRSDSALMVSKKSYAEKEKKQIDMEQKGMEQVQEVVLIGDQVGSAKRKAEKTTALAETTAEKKAAKIERLKSGFRICKPQGTFLWPSMARNNYNAASNGVSPQVVVQVEDLLVVPTPPSVSSSSALAPPQLTCPPGNHHRPPSPVKPVAERRAVTVTISAMSNDHGDQGFSTTTTTTTTTTTNKSPTCFNLNDIPSANPVEDFSNNPTSQRTITTSTSVTPSLVPDTVMRSEMVNGPWDVITGGIGAGRGTWEAPDCYQKKLSKCSSSSASCLSAEAVNWLALSTANSASDESSHG